MGIRENHTVPKQLLMHKTRVRVVSAAEAEEAASNLCSISSQRSRH